VVQKESGEKEWTEARITRTKFLGPQILYQPKMTLMLRILMGEREHQKSPRRDVIHKKIILNV
jgi:hypothetical protein